MVHIISYNYLKKNFFIFFLEKELDKQLTKFLETPKIELKNYQGIKAIIGP